MPLDSPIVVTGAAGRIDGVGRTVVELLRQRNLPVRALVRREDERAMALASHWRRGRNPRPHTGRGCCVVVRNEVVLRLHHLRIRFVGVCRGTAAGGEPEG